jgi:AGCS family alanine or glycine:cation symporter
MDILTWLLAIDDLTKTPFAILFFAVAVILTIKFGFLQFRVLPRFFQLISGGVKERHKRDASKISSFQALFTAMAGTIGMGNIVGPSVAIYFGGPGALFWLLLYIFFGSMTKLTEVVLGLHTRERLPDGHIVGGPMQYLKKVHPFLGYWYMSIVTFLFMVWSGVQSNTLGQIFAMDGIPSWTVGIGLALLVYLVVQGGIHRIGVVASKLVPLMFVLYVSFALLILFQDIPALCNAFWLIGTHIFKPAASIGAFTGASIMTAMKWGVYRSIHITEAGLGSSSIAHSMSDTNHPLDQGILAMVSMLADATLSMLSGLLVLVTGIWMQGIFRPTLVYEAFKMSSPLWGGIVLVISVSLFVITTVIGNTFNGMQAFASLTRDRYINWYLGATLLIMVCGSIMEPRAAWSLTDIILTLAVIPNIIGVAILAFRNPGYFKLGKSN